MPQIRVLQVFSQMDRGGAETMLMNIYRNVDRSRVQFDFLTHTEKHCEYDDEIQELGGKIFYAPRYKVVNHLTYRAWFNRFFKTHPEYQIIHGHQYSTASIYLSIAKKYGLITIAHSHSTSNGTGPSALVKNMLQRPLYRIADYCFACSQNAGEWLYRNKRRFTILSNAIDVRDYQFSSDIRIEKRRELHIASDTFVIGHVGSFSLPKNHIQLIEIFSAIHKRHLDSRLLLVGDGPLRDEIKKKICALSLEDAVILTGVRTDVPALLQAMDVFAFPSLFEGLGVALIEAQAAGLPCICSDTITNEAAITNLCTFLPLSQPKIWVNSILDFCGQERQDTCQQVIDAGYDVQSTAKWMEDFYLSAWNGRKRRH